MTGNQVWLCIGCAKKVQRRGVQAEFNIGVKGLVAGYDTVGNYPVNENEALVLPMLLMVQHYRMMATVMLVSIMVP